MKLRNKKTGDIYELNDFCLYDDKGFAKMPFLKSLAELNEEWEDYEEPKEHWCVTMYGGITRIKDDEEPIDDLIEIGNYFNSKEDAYDALDKLKAWKRLKEKGFRFKDYTRRFDGFKRVDGSVFITAELNDEGVIGMIDELNICFGGEDE